MKKLKNYIFIFNEKYKINFFLIKFKSKLKNKILSINNVLNIRKKIFVKILI